MKSISQISHDIKHRESPKDEFYTPIELAKYTISMVDLKPGDVVLDSAYGTGNYFNNYPSWTSNKYTTDFFNFNEEVDWIITNPPYSKIDDYLKHSAEICRKGFAYLLGHDNLTPRRIEYLEKLGFYITRIHKSNVFKWYGISEFVIFEKGIGKGIIDYDRKVWYPDDCEKEIKKEMSIEVDENQMCIDDFLEGE